MARPAAVLDANVLYPARLRDLFLRLAIAGHYRALWTDRILDDCFHNLLSDRPDIPAEHLHRTRHVMTVAIPDAVVEDYDHLIDDLHLPDPDDRHVLAAAVAASANLIVTGNLTDFPPAAVPAGITVLSPDDFVLNLIHIDIDAVATVVDQQAGALSNPPMTTAELLVGLAIVGVRQSVDALRCAARHSRPGGFAEAWVATRSVLVSRPGGGPAPGRVETCTSTHPTRALGSCSSVPSRARSRC